MEREGKERRMEKWGTDWAGRRAIGEREGGEKSKTLRKERNRCGTGKEEVGECYGGKFWKRD